MLDLKGCNGLDTDKLSFLNPPLCLGVYFRREPMEQGLDEHLLCAGGRADEAQSARALPLPVGTDRQYAQDTIL